MVAVDSCHVWHASFISLMVLQGALAQWYEGPGGAPPCIPARRRCSQKISACLASTPLTALTLTVCVEVCMAVAGGVILLFIQTVAERASISELPVHTGDIKTITVLQQLRGGGVGEGAAAPWAVLVRF